MGCFEGPYVFGVRTCFFMQKQSILKSFRMSGSEFRVPGFGIGACFFFFFLLFLYYSRAQNRITEVYEPEIRARLRITTHLCTAIVLHPEGNPRANLGSISHRCHPILVAFLWEMTKETINLPLGRLQGGRLGPASSCRSRAS